MSEHPELRPPEGPPAGAAVIEERLHPLTPVVHVWLLVAAAGWFVLNDLLRGSLQLSDLQRLREAVPWWAYLAGGALVVFLAFGYWSWWTTRFIIDDTELRIENAGAFQESKRIAFSRIQAIDIRQPFAARILGLAELHIDVGADDGTKLAFLTRPRAAELRDYLMRRAHGHAVTAGETGAAASAWDDLASTDEVLIRLTPVELAVATLLSVEFLLTLMLLGTPVAIGLAFGWPELLVGTGLIPIVLALGGVVGTRLISQFNSTLARTDAGLRITRGLLTLKSQTVPAHRVQAIRISQPLPWRWLNRARLDVTVLGVNGNADEPATTILLPTGSPRQVQTALAAVWPGLALDRLDFHPPPRQARWLAPLAYPWLGYALDDRVIVSRTGWLVRAQHVVPHARLQSITLRQGPLQRRLRLASIHLHTTNMLGAETVEHTEQGAARWLVDTEMDRARASRTDELIDPPGLRSAVALDPDAAPATSVWTPPTSVAAAPPSPPGPPGAPAASRGAASDGPFARFAGDDPLPPGHR